MTDYAEHIYNELYHRQFVSSLRQFSTEFLGRSPNYFAGKDASASLESLIFLHNKLREKGIGDLAASVVTKIFGNWDRAELVEQEDDYARSV